MPQQENHIEIRSEEVQEILSHVPHWLIRWGITVIFLVIGVILLASWFIKYPDTVPAQVVITSKIPPAHLVARTSGRIDLRESDNASVKKDQLLAIIENAASNDDMERLIATIREVRPKIYQKPLDLDGIQLDTKLDLGQMQVPFFNLATAIQNIKRFKSIAVFKNRKRIQNERIGYYREVNEKLERQLKLLGQEVLIAQRAYKDDSILLTKGAEYKRAVENSRSNYLNAERGRQSLESQVIQNAIRIDELQSQISELNLEEQQSKETLETAVVQAFEKLETDLQGWKQSYYVTSPIEGLVSFSKIWSDDQYVQQGQVVMSVIPNSEEVMGIVSMPVRGSGKVQEGQKVNIKLENYPYNEYGMVIGKIENISLVPQDNLYQIRISLPDGLLSTYNKNLDFKQEMQGLAEIVTEDRRLIERVFNQLRNILDKAK